MPDRLPSLLVLAGFWVPPAVAGWAVARAVRRGAGRNRATAVKLALVPCVVAWAAIWFQFNVLRMPPYVPGALPDPVTPPPPGTVRWLAWFTAGVILPGSAVACALGWRMGRDGPPSR